MFYSVMYAEGNIQMFQVFIPREGEMARLNEVGKARHIRVP